MYSNPILLVPMFHCLLVFVDVPLLECLTGLTYIHLVAEGTGSDKPLPSLLEFWFSQTDVRSVTFS